MNAADRIAAALDAHRRVDTDERDARRARIAAARDAVRRPPKPTDPKALAAVIARCEHLSLDEQKAVARKLASTPIGRSFKIGGYTFTRSATGSISIHRDKTVTTTRVVTMAGVDAGKVFGLR